MSAHGKKTRNPGWRSGDNWVTCDRCGFTIYASEARKTWDGLVVCPDDWEPRHEQDFVRGIPDHPAPKGHRRSEPADVFVADPGYVDKTGDPDYTVPDPTHENDD